MKTITLALLLILSCIPTLPSQEAPVATIDSTINVCKAQVEINVASDVTHMIDDLQLLHPYLRSRVLMLIDSCRQRGITVEVRETYRSSERQDYLAKKKKKVTNVTGGNSYHQYGMAVDVVIVVNGKYAWSNKKLWKQVGSIGESLGLRWGGRWSRLWDPGHFEWSGDCDITQLKQGHRPQIVSPITDQRSENIVSL